jgi:nucleoid DNA-binding protein
LASVAGRALTAPSRFRSLSPLMTKLELLERVYRSAVRKGKVPPGTTKKSVGLLIDSVFDELSDYFVKAKLGRQGTPKFTYPGFGTFTKRRRAERAGRNPRTGEAITIPGAVTVRFTPGVDFKQLLNRR